MMTKKEEFQNILDAIWPQDGEVWVKIKVINQNKCHDLFRTVNNEEIGEQYGFHSTKINILPVSKQDLIFAKTKLMHNLEVALDEAINDDIFDNPNKE